MRHKINLSILLALFWLLNSGHYSNLMLFLGVLSIAVVIFIAHRMDVVDHESQSMGLSLAFTKYGLWLSKEIIVANVAVVKHIWLGNKTISPTMTKVKASQTTDVGKVIYANSITLTPGTISLDVRGDAILVHNLTSEMAEDLLTGDMDRRVTKLEGKV